MEIGKPQCSDRKEAPAISHAKSLQTTFLGSSRSWRRPLIGQNINQSVLFTYTDCTVKFIFKFRLWELLAGTEAVRSTSNSWEGDHHWDRPQTICSPSSSEQFDSLPPWILNFHLHMDQFAYNIHYVPAKNFSTNDTLSRAPLTSTIHDHSLEELAERLMSAQIDQLPASKEWLEQYCQAQH